MNRIILTGTILDYPDRKGLCLKYSFRPDGMEESIILAIKCQNEEAKEKVIDMLDADTRLIITGSLKAENVKGILTANKRSAFPLIISEFEKSGYNVSYTVLNAVNFGVPQKRERVIIVGFRKDLKINFKFPLPIIENEEYFVPLSSIIEKEVAEKYFFSEKAVAGMMKNRASMNKGRAQDINKPCNTVGAHLAKISLNSTDPVLVDKGRYRRFTPREVARIQSFPENFKLLGSETAQYRALGNAIPPVMFWYIAKAIMEQFPKEDKYN